MVHERALIALLLLATIAGACTCCCSRAVPIIPDDWRSGGGNNTYNYSYYNVTDTYYVNYTNYTTYAVNYSDYWWFVSGTWLVNNRTAATSGVNVSGTNGNTYLTGNNINFDRAGPNYIQAMDGSGSLYLGSGGTSGVIGLLNSALVDSLLINGNGVGVYMDAEEFEFSVAGALLATENVSSPLLNTSCINLANELVCSWAAVNGSSSFNDTNLWNNASSQSGQISALQQNASDQADNASIQSGQIAAGALNDSLQSGQISTLAGYAQANYTSFESNDSIQSGQIALGFSYAQANYTAFESNASLQSGNIASLFTNASTVWVWLLGLATDNTTHFTNASLQATQIVGLEANDTNLWANASLQSGQIAGIQANVTSVNDTSFANDFIQDNTLGALTQNDTLINGSVVHIAGSETVTGEKVFSAGTVHTGNLTQYGSDGTRGFYLNETSGTANFGNATVFALGSFQWVGSYSSWLRIENNGKGAIARYFHSRGTPTSPLPLWDGDDLMAFEAGGYDGSTLAMQSSAGIMFTALGGYTSTNHGSKMSFEVTPENSTTTRSAVVVNGTGVVSLPYQSSVRAFNSSVTSVVGTTAKKAVFNSETYDIQGEYANSRFTPANGGVYSVSATLDFATAGTTKFLQVRRNGNVVKEVLTDGRRTSLTISDQLALAVGDYLEIWVRTDGGTNTIYGGSENMTVTIMKVA